MPQRVVLRIERQMRRDRDAMRFPVDDLSSRQLAPGQTHERGSESESVRQSIVEKLKLSLRVGIGNRKQPAQRNKISRFGRA
jgi:hypothetical protein